MDKLERICHHSLVSSPRSRPSRFDDAMLSVHALAPGDEFTPMERRNQTQPKAGIDIVDELWAPAPLSDVITDALCTVQVIASPWELRWVIARRGGQLVVRGLHLEPNTRTTPPGGITSNMLRELSPTRALATVGAGDAPSELEQTMIRTAETLRKFYLPENSEAEAPTRGRPRVSDHELAQVALLYLDELSHGSGVTKRLSGRLDMPESTVRDRIRMCRERGFLTATKQGRRGGEPGPRLRALLESMKAGPDA